GDALLGLVNDILDFSKIEAGKMELESISFSPRTCVEQASDILALRAQEKGLELTVLVEPDVPERVLGDPARLRQVLLNLGSNAVKFTEKGDVTIHVRRELGRSQGIASGSPAGLLGGRNLLRFEVVDTGIGIPEDKRERLFRSFSQVDASTTRRFGGTGLGLAISKRLVELMEGAIGVESTEGAGSTFWFTARLEPTASAARLPVVAPSSLKGRRVLIVDGNAISRRVVREMLKSWGCDWAEAAGASEALAKLRAAATSGQAIDVALLDYQVPGLGGDSLGVEIKQDAALSKTILILLTSMPRRGDLTSAESQGFAAYLTKPLKKSVLREALEAIFAEGGSTRRPSVHTLHSLADSIGRKPWILVVDDNVVNQKVAVKMLEKAGCRCDVASDGREAVEAVGRRRYDIVFMDCQMPVLDGYAAATEIRLGEPEGARVPIVAMTAEAMPGDRERCLAAGMDDYVAKPFAFDELYRVLGRFVRAEIAPVSGVTVVSGPEEPVLDPGRIREISDGDLEFEGELWRLFESNTASCLAGLAQALESGDVVRARREAHSLKGLAMNVGAGPFARLAGDAERDLVERRPAPVLRSLPDLVRARDLVLAERDRLNSMSGKWGARETSRIKFRSLPGGGSGGIEKPPGSGRHAAQEFLLRAVEQRRDVIGPERQLAGDILARQLLEHAHRDDPALDVGQPRDAALEPHVPFGHLEELIGAELGPGQVLPLRDVLVGQRAEGAATHVAGGVPHHHGEQTPRVFGVPHQRARLRQGEKRLEGLLDGVQRVLCPQALLLRHGCERAGVGEGQIGNPADEGRGLGRHREGGF
ncbi:MAG: response regulator, partial [Acidobacteria bacterium]|nr:response regulator [Acidobacteriota bacterium]